jgi:hypothetical protein
MIRVVEIFHLIQNHIGSFYFLKYASELLLEMRLTLESKRVQQMSKRYQETERFLFSLG